MKTVDEIERAELKEQVLCRINGKGEERRLFRYKVLVENEADGGYNGIIGRYIKIEGGEDLKEILRKQGYWCDNEEWPTVFAQVISREGGFFLCREYSFFEDIDAGCFVLEPDSLILVSQELFQAVSRIDVEYQSEVIKIYDSKKDFVENMCDYKQKIVCFTRLPLITEDKE